LIREDPSADPKGSRYTDHTSRSLSRRRALGRSQMISQSGVSVYVLVSIIKKRLNLSRRLYEMLQILSLNLFEKAPLDTALSSIPGTPASLHDSNQLIHFCKRMGQAWVRLIGSGARGAALRQPM
jgi:hypothetical protein